MVSFRFHLVSLTAVFLALAAGIAVGAAVVDRASVDFLEARLDNVERNRARTNSENDQLRAEVGFWDAFTQQAGDQLVQGRLAGVPLLLIATEGTERGVVDSLRRLATAAGARVDGTLWLTAKWALADPGHVQEMAALLGAPGEDRPDVVRRAAIGRLTAGWRSGDGGAFAASLQTAAFLDLEATRATPAELARLPLPGTRFVVVSSEDADVPNDLLAVPLVQLLAAGDAVPVLAAEPTPPQPARGVTPPPAFVAALRGDSETASRISTVDNVSDYRGRTAVVLALEQLGRGRSGHFGQGAGAERLVPEPLP